MWKNFKITLKMSSSVGNFQMKIFGSLMKQVLKQHIKPTWVITQENENQVREATSSERGKFIKVYNGVNAIGNHILSFYGIPKGTSKSSHVLGRTSRNFSSWQSQELEKVENTKKNL